ncbi:uncharacterized protein TrAtP1_013183 [Trichoderma atroviride]|uniref:uncharacterized protein n=1 Tax=Hypocrea atroviridis TaxID=63577 RepID=UPI00332E7DCF|nr:hypothetical protein TrAtP1_013183 [Trichoderma atroviride]
MASLPVAQVLGLIFTSCAAVGFPDMSKELVMGNRGPVGLAWASTTTVGSLAAMKTCLAAAAPGWLREDFLLRDPTIDAAIGLTSNVNRRSKRRKNRARALGIARKGKEEEVTQFDGLTKQVLSSIPKCEKGQTLSVYRFLRDPYMSAGTTWGNWIGLSVTLLKIFDLYLLYFRHGKLSVAILTIVPWAVCFFVAVVMLRRNALRAIPVRDAAADVADILEGELPTADNPGGYRRVLLGTPVNPRQGLIWKLGWILIALSCVASLAANWLVLYIQNDKLTKHWMACQLFWTLARSIFFHFAEEMKPVPAFRPRRESLNDLPGADKEHIQRLVLGLAKYEMHFHPRGGYSYGQDLLSFESMELFLAVPTTDKFPVESLCGDKTQPTLNFKAVLGDVLLVSVSWLLGSSETRFDLYDCCIVAVTVNGQPLIIPAARALASTIGANAAQDTEMGEDDIIFEKGSENEGPDTTKWVYWIPCSDGTWLEAQSDKSEIIGSRHVEIFTNDGLTDHLQLKQKDWRISLRRAEEVGEVVKKSCDCSRWLDQIWSRPA